MSAPAAADEGRCVRLFFGLWPDDAVRSALGALAHEAQAEAGGRAMAAGNIHLTLFFVGMTEPSRIAALEAAAGEARGEAFEIGIDRIGYWRHNRIVWAGCAATPAALATLEASLRNALVRLGCRAEDRPYVPHITLVRNARRKPQPRDIARCAWRVEDFALVESAPAGGGVCYRVRRRWPLCL